MTLSANSPDGLSRTVEAFGAGTVATQLEGEKIARDVKELVRVRALLAERPRRFGPMAALAALALGLGWAWMATQTSATGLLAIVAGVGFFSAIAAFRECMSLRRRLDAALVLLNAHDEQLNR